MYELRPYQADALDTVTRRLKESRRVLLQAAVGAGKTVIFAELIRRYMTEYPAMRIGVAAHREELVRQAADKLLKTWPEGLFSVGMACASVGKPDTGKPVTVGSVQTMARRKFAEPFRLLILDEVHHLTWEGERSQYHDLIDAQEAMNPELRVLGVTATPFRLGHGYIYGDRCREGRTNFFPSLDWSVTMAELIAQGHLSPLRGKRPVDMRSSLSRVAKSKGDYEIGALSDEMSRKLHIDTAVETYGKYGEGRRHVLVFAVSIAHAELLAAAFRADGHRASAVHSEMDRNARRAALDGFGAGEVDVLVNVGVLTEGWDSPAVDLIMLCRPTLSPGLYVQMLGRGTRLAPGKKDLLYLDLADCHRTHGDPSDPKVTWNGGDREWDPPFKDCPECGAIVPLSAGSCPECGHVFVTKPRKPETVAPEMEEIFRSAEGERLKVSGWLFFDYETKAGDMMARLDVHFWNAPPVSVFLDFEGQASGWGALRAKKLWAKLSGWKGRIPETVDEAVGRAEAELTVPDELTVRKDRKGYRVIREWQS